MEEFKIKSREALLVDMGILMSYEELMTNIFKYIYAAADRKERTITYIFPDKVTKKQKDYVYTRLAELGYITNGVGTNVYTEIVISW